MGYAIKQRAASFLIRPENKAKALAAIKALVTKVNPQTGQPVWGSPAQFSWVETSEFMEATTLEDALNAWRWDSWDSAECPESISGIRFKGEKAGQDSELFRAIAPYVEKDSYIEMMGECGEIFRWFFDGKTCEEQTGTIVWKKTGNYD